MGITDMKNKLQGWARKLTERREDGQPLSNMPNGSVSGYQPRVVRRHVEMDGPEVHPASAFAGMVPAGVDPAGIPTYNPPMQSQQPPSAPPMQQAPGAFGQRPMQGVQGMQGTMQMPPLNAQQPVQGGRFMPNAPIQGAGYQPRHQSTPQNPWQGAYPQGAYPQGGYQPQHGTGSQGNYPPQQPVQAATPQTPPQAPAEPNVRFFPGTVRDEEGNGYSVVLRVAQITGIPSCYHLLEFMHNNEAVIVNAEQITDTVEADRCLDMLFGAAYAMNQTFERIAGRLIYLIAPRHVHVLPFDSVLHMSQQDIERRWPGSTRSAGADGRYGRRDDFDAIFGQGASSQPGAYTDFGGFGGFSARR